MTRAQELAMELQIAQLNNNTAKKTSGIEEHRVAHGLYGGNVVLKHKGRVDILTIGPELQSKPNPKFPNLAGNYRTITLRPEGKTGLGKPWTYNVFENQAPTFYQELEEVYDKRDEATGETEIWVPNSDICIWELETDEDFFIIIDGKKAAYADGSLVTRNTRPLVTLENESVQGVARRELYSLRNAFISNNTAPTANDSIEGDPQVETAETK